MQKVILYYKFVPIDDTETMLHWQRAICEQFGLRGRILISEHGINGTLGGDTVKLKRYIRAMNAHSLMKGITWKWSDGSADDFPRLSVKVRPELVTFGIPEEVEVNAAGVVGGGVHLKPDELHKLVAERGDDVVFFDGRNAYEAEIGKFKNALVPNTRTTKDFLRELERPDVKSLKKKPVVTYCTGGIRCEILTALMKNRGFEEVYQLDGGIAKYGEAYQDEGLWEGKMYVFDRRMHVSFSERALDIGICTQCGTRTSQYINCANKACNELLLMCDTCAQDVRYCKDCQSHKKQEATI